MDREHAAPASASNQETKAPIDPSGTRWPAVGHAPSGRPLRRLSLRRRLAMMVGALAVAGLIGTPVASAAPGQTGWDFVEGRLFNGCTGEYWDDRGRVHFVETDSGPFHFNVLA